MQIAKAFRADWLFSYMTYFLNLTPIYFRGCLFFSFPSEEDLDVDQFCASTGIGKPEQGHHRKASAPAAFGAGLFSSSAKMASSRNQTHLSTPDPGHSQCRYGPQNNGKNVDSTFSNTLITSFSAREVNICRYFWIFARGQRWSAVSKDFFYFCKGHWEETKQRSTSSFSKRGTLLPTPTPHIPWKLTK